MRILAFFLASFLFIFPAFASEPETEVNPDETLVETVEPYTTFEILQLPEGTRIVTDEEPAGISEVEIAVQSMDPVTPTNANGLKKILLNILGDYSAIQVEMRYTNNNGTYSYQREIQPDYVWLCSAGLFVICLWSIFRLVGVFFCKQ